MRKTDIAALGLALILAACPSRKPPPGETPPSGGAPAKPIALPVDAPPSTSPRSIETWIPVLGDLKEEKRERAVQVSQALRRTGRRVSVELMGRRLPDQLRYADRIQAELVVVLDAETEREDTCKLRRRAPSAEQVVPLAELAARLAAEELSR